MSWYALLAPEDAKSAGAAADSSGAASVFEKPSVVVGVRGGIREPLPRSTRASRARGHAQLALPASCGIQNQKATVWRKLRTMAKMPTRKPSEYEQSE